MKKGIKLLSAVIFISMITFAIFMQCTQPELNEGEPKPSKSSNTNLSSLTISSGTLTPSFSSSITSYNASVDNFVVNVTVTPTIEDVKSSIQVRINGGSYSNVDSASQSGALSINVGSNTIDILVTAQDSSTKIYTITVIRAGSSNANLSNLTISSGILTPSFSSSINAYSVSVINSITSVTVTPAVADVNSTVEANGTSVTSGQPSQSINLNVGLNNIEISVTAQDLSINIYTITVTRAGSSNALLSNLTISSGVLTPSFSSSTNAYSVSVANNVANVTVTPTAADVNSTVEVNGTSVTSGQPSQSINLNVGLNNIEITVTAQDTSINIYTITVTRSGSNNANLSNLSISSGTLTPSFSSSITGYSALVSNTTASVTVIPTKEEVNAMIQVRVNGGSYEFVSSGATSNSLSLNYGSNTVEILVTAQDGTEKIYTITVIRELSSNSNLSNLTISNGTLTPSFASGTVSYSASVASDISSITVTPTKEDANAVIQARVNSETYQFVTSGAPSNSLSLNYGSNTIEILVTAQDESFKLYTITVTRALSSNSNLSNLTISSGTLTPAFTSGTVNYSVSVTNNTSSITVTLTKEDLNATIQVRINGGAYQVVSSGTSSNSLSLNYGSNTIEILVTAQDESFKLYTITVNRLLSNNVNLSNLTISSGILTPVFSSNTTSYSVIVANALTSVTVTPTKEDVNSSITVNGTTVASGQPSQSISLNVGINIINITVTAQDATFLIYTVTVTRLSNNNNLSSLSISSGTLTPAFSSSTIIYNVSVANTVDSVTITPTKEDANATIQVRINGGAYQVVSSGTPSNSLSLNYGANTIDILVTAQDNTTKLYTITVTRVLSSNSNLSSLTISSGTLTPAFASGTVSYSASVASDISSITVTPTKEDANAVIQVRVNGGSYEFVTSGTPSNSLSLNYGANTIDILLTAQDESFKLYTITVTRVLSSNSNLSNLTISSGTLNPAFASQTVNYSVSVPNTITSVTVTTTKEDANAIIQVRVNGGNYEFVSSGTPSNSLSLNYGSNTIEILVTAQDESFKLYTITTTRALSSNSNLSSLTISSGTLTPTFSSGIVTYSVSLSNDTESITVTPTKEDALAIIQVRVNGGSYEYVSSGTPSNSLSLNYGSNTIEILVTAQDESVKIYTITATRVLSSNNNLSNLTISNGALTPAFATNVTSYTSSVQNAIESITVTPTKQDANATIQIRINGGAYSLIDSGTSSGDLSLNVGNNTIEILITAQDTSTKTYTVIMNRISNNADLSNLTMSSGTFSPEFSTDIINYTALVDNIIAGITVTPTTADAYASIRVRVNSGTYINVNSGYPSGNLSLNFGDNLIEIQVTAQDGSTIKLYSIIVSRPISSNANLSNIELSAGFLNPEFSSNLTYYGGGNVVVSSIKVTPTSENPYSTLQIRINMGEYFPVTSGTPSNSLNLEIGWSDIDILVTAQDGITIKKYTVAIRRLSNITSLSSLNFYDMNNSDVSLSPAFSSSIYSYSAAVPSNISYVTLIAESEDGTMELKVNSGSFVPIDDYETDPINLNIGINTFVIRVTAADGITYKTYNINVRRISDNCDLSDLTLTAGTLTPSFSSEITSYTLSPVTVESIRIRPTALYSSTIIQIRFNSGDYITIPSGSLSESLSLDIGVTNVIDIFTESEDGENTKWYRIYITRLSNNANLYGLELSDGTLIPSFNSETLNYTSSISYLIPSIAVTPTAAYSKSKIEVNLNGGTYSQVVSGMPSGNLALNIGSNTINVKVTAEDNVTIKTYIITVQKVFPELSYFTTYDMEMSYTCNGVSLNSDGSKALVAGFGEARFYDTTTNTPLRIFDVDMGYTCNGVSLNADGSKALVAGYGEARLFDTATGTQLRIFDVDMGYTCNGVSLNADGSKALVAGYGEARLFDTATGTQLRIFDVDMGYTCKGVSLNSDGSKALVAGYGEARLFDTATGTQLRIFDMDMGNTCNAVSLNSDGSIALIGGYRYAKIFNTATGALLRTFNMEMSYTCNGVSLSFDGSLALVAGYRYAKLFETSTGSLLQTFNMEMSYTCNGVSLNSNGTIALISGFRGARLFK